MKNLSSSEVRQMFLDFFVEKGHSIEKSAPLVPVDDPTLLWINSGVATLKKYFDGSIVPSNPRIVNSQKSIRTNDIENVGKTARHHTMFEMLGNFSIGDYFKEDAIKWAWEFLTSDKWLDMNPEKLYVTVYPEDDEARRIWKEVVGLTNDHVIDEEGNFWDIGAGPSGPNSEIFFDRGEAFNNLEANDPENYPGGENERWLEIWNIVFSEFNHKPDDTYEPLPHKNIDTGMGLERLVSVLQDTPTNFETDLFMPIIKKIEQLSGEKYGIDSTKDVSFKVISDHIRAIAFAIGDGALPSNEGRGYVLRRLLRRAVMHGRKLSIDSVFLFKLVAIVADNMKDFYPEVEEKSDFIVKIIKKEEERFQETIHDGLLLLNEVIDEAKEKGNNKLDGKNVFKLYDTYGFPYELTEEYAEEAGLSIDKAGYEKEMTAQRERARAARSDEQSMAEQNELLMDFDANSVFAGYTNDRIPGEIIAIVGENGFLDTVEPGTSVQLVFNQTPFYAEKGGQVADKGAIYNREGEKIAEVTDVQSAPAGQALHQVTVLQTLQLNEPYLLAIQSGERELIRKNHTATHLLHQALKDVLGEHVAQAGSLVSDQLLRFDFTHFSQITEDELKKIEEIVNDKIWSGLPVNTIVTSLDEAKKSGAVALFGEKYGESVRIVDIGSYSKELCGGTHVFNTNEIGMFKITSESGIGAGIRRIVAKTSKGAFEFMEEQEELLKQVSLLLKAQQPKDVPSKVEQLTAQLKESQKENEALQSKLSNSLSDEVFKQVKESNGYSFIASEVNLKNMNQLRQLADQWKQKDYSDILVLGLKHEGKANLLAAVSPDANKKGIKAGDLIKAVSPLINGGGGGRPDMAQAGGKNPDGLTDALAQVERWIESKA